MASSSSTTSSRSATSASTSSSSSSSSITTSSRVALPNTNGPRERVFVSLVLSYLWRGAEGRVSVTCDQDLCSRVSLNAEGRARMIAAITRTHPQYILGLRTLPDRVRWNEPQWLSNRSPEGAGFQLHDRYWAWMNLVSTLEGDPYYRPNAYGLKSYFIERLSSSRGRLTEVEARVFVPFLPTQGEYVWQLVSASVEHGYLETAIDILRCDRPSNLAVDGYYMKPVFARCIMNNTEPFIRLTNLLLTDPVLRDFFRNNMGDVVWRALEIDAAAKPRIVRRLFEIVRSLSQLPASSSADSNGSIAAIFAALTHYRFSQQHWACSQEERAQLNTNLLEMITLYPAITDTDANIKAAFIRAVSNGHAEIALGLFNRPRGACIDCNDIASLPVADAVSWIARLPENRWPPNLDALARLIQHEAIHGSMWELIFSHPESVVDEMIQNGSMRSEITPLRQMVGFAAQHANRLTRETRHSLVTTILSQRARRGVFEETTINGLIAALGDATVAEIGTVIQCCRTHHNRFGLLRLMSAYRDRLSVGYFLEIIQREAAETASRRQNLRIIDLLCVFKQKVGTTPLSIEEQRLLAQILVRCAREDTIFAHRPLSSECINTPIATDEEKSCLAWLLEEGLTRDQARRLIGILINHHRCQKYHFLFTKCKPSFFDDAIRTEILRSVFELHSNAAEYVSPEHVEHLLQLPEPRTRSIEAVLRLPPFRTLPGPCVNLFLVSLRERMQQRLDQTPLVWLLTLSQPGSLPDSLFVGAIEAIIDHIMPANPSGNITRCINGNPVRCQYNGFTQDNVPPLLPVLTPLLNRGPVFAQAEPNTPTQLPWLLTAMLYMGEVYPVDVVIEKIYSYIRLPSERADCCWVFAYHFVKKLPESFITHATPEQMRKVFLFQCNTRNGAFFDANNMQRVLSACQSALAEREQVDGAERTTVDRVLERLLAQAEQRDQVQTAVSSILSNIPDSALSTLVSGDIVQRLFNAFPALSSLIRTKFGSIVSLPPPPPPLIAPRPTAPSTASSSTASTAARSPISSAVTPSPVAPRPRPSLRSQAAPDEPSSIATSFPRAAVPQAQPTLSQAPLPVVPAPSGSASFAATFSPETTSSQDPDPITENGSIDPPDLTQLFPSDDYEISRSGGGAISIRTRGGSFVSVSAGGVRRSRRSPHAPTPPSSDSGLHPPATRSPQCIALYAIGIILTIGCGLASGLGAAYGMKIVFVASFAGAGGAVAITLIAVACLRARKNYDRISLG